MDDIGDTPMISLWKFMGHPVKSLRRSIAGEYLSKLPFHFDYNLRVSDINLLIKGKTK